MQDQMKQTMQEMRERLCHQEHDLMVANNENPGDDPGKRATYTKLAAVYRRGAGAYSVSHRPGVSRGAWAMARVNAFLYLLRRGRPEDAKYKGDNDLLPKAHPRGRQ